MNRVIKEENDLLSLIGIETIARLTQMPLQSLLKQALLSSREVCLLDNGITILEQAERYAKSVLDARSMKYYHLGDELCYQVCSQALEETKRSRTANQLKEYMSVLNQRKNTSEIMDFFQRIERAAISERIQRNYSQGMEYAHAA